ncbi:PH domain-containing protein [Oceanobacillus rekensis]|uniref:PH domain-containing protein n=1 Tax=Oceanobacillus rekensis TaxID=937927 RepID=UPI000B438ECD|nr:PH domain-containing protein [Oceanobacillus rekensis]
MLKKLASDALGLSDIGKIIEPQDYDKTDADDYVRHEDNEEIYFLIMTKADEYCFTNLALIHVDGENAASSKRTMKRYPYSQHTISNVLLETAGKIDRDIEIKFSLGNEVFSIDVHKEEIDKLKDLYKALLYISEKMHDNSVMLNMAGQSLDKAVSVLQNSRTSEADLASQYKQLTEFGFSWMESARKDYHQKDFGAVFKKYINN